LRRVISGIVHRIKGGSSPSPSLYRIFPWLSIPSGIISQISTGIVIHIRCRPLIRARLSNDILIELQPDAHLPKQDLEPLLQRLPAQALISQLE
jgi:hypothetical protein